MRIGLVIGSALLGVALVSGPLPAADQPASAERQKAKAEDLFRKQVAPLLARRCLNCHNEQDRKGDFSLETAAAVRDSGFVEPGDPDSSHLLTVLVSADGKPAAMPKDAPPLRTAEVALVRRWIADGARWPKGLRLEPPRVVSLDWWSLRPVRKPKPPALDGSARDWLRTPIDAFVMARLRRNKLSPSPPADRRTLIRRLSYDLLGLPPQPQEVEAFVRSRDPQAYEKLVDRLLASPHYGERWARHWLDVVHYGDTHGYDKDKLRPNAWPYRDYVIRAFNADKPYGRFVQEQLAGDVLWPGKVDGQVGPGFIAAGPWDYIGHAEVPETKIDGRVARNLDRDDMVTNTMNSFCSLTVQCARCHHHKLDPITMDQYYRLQAVFAAVDRADRDYDADPQVAARRRALRQQEASVGARLAKVEKELAARKTPQIRQLEKEIARLQEARAEGKIGKVPRSARYGYHSQVAAKPETTKWVQVDLGSPLPIDDILLFGADEYGWSDFGFPERFHVDAARTADMTGATRLHESSTATARPGRQAVRIRGRGITARYVRVTATRLWSRRHKGAAPTNDWIFALGELAIVSRQHLVRPRAVTARDSIESMPRWGKANLIDGVYGAYGAEALVGNNRRSPSNGYHSRFAKKPDVTKWVQIDLGKPQAFDAIQLTPAFPTDWADAPGFGFPVRFRLEASNDPDFARPQVLISATTDFPNPLHRDVVYRFPQQTTQQPSKKPSKKPTARYVRLTATRLWDRGGKHYALALAEIRVLHSGRNLAAGASVAASDSIEGGRWGKARLVDGYSSRLPITERAKWLLTRAQPPADSQQLAKRIAERDRLLAEALPPELLRTQQRLRDERKRVTQQMKELPRPQRVYVACVHRGQGAFRGRAGLGPREIRVLHRGDVTRPGKPVKPGAPALFAHAEDTFALSQSNDEGARRVALSQWIIRRDNPLTWRSIVNRIWLYHFGRGIVATPNDFGRGGEKPTHPELLDYLAAEFREHQSIKRLHRLIVTSAVYRQSSQSDPQRAAVDGGNRFYWRMSRRRLTAEEIRDSMLELAGLLNRKMGGPGFQDFVIEQPQHSPHYEYHKHDPNDPGTHRRAVYRFLVRSQPQPFMDTLDCADPSMSVPRRAETLTPLQALALLNNRFMVTMSQRFATRLQRGRSSVREQLASGVHAALGRGATPDELTALERYARQHGLANACRVIINLNEFVFVD